MEGIYSGKHYNIYKIGESCPEEDDDILQYKIFIKEKTCKAKKPASSIDRDCYSSLEGGLEEAHRVAKEAIADHFQSE